MISSSPESEILSLDAVHERAEHVGESMAEYLRAPYLAGPIAAFFVETAHIAHLDGAVLAIQDDESSGPNLASYGIADLSRTTMPNEAERCMIRSFRRAVSKLDDAVFAGPVPIGMSFEFINRHTKRMDDILRGLETGKLESLCGIPFPPASRLAILSRASDHA